MVRFLKSIVKAFKTFLNMADFHKEIVKSRYAISQMSKEIIVLREQISELMDIAREIKEKARFDIPEEEVEFSPTANAYIGKSTSHFYCSPCRDTKHQLVKLHTNGAGRPFCPICKPKT